MKKYWYWLCNIEGIGIKKRELLLGRFKTPEAVFRAKETDFSKLAGITKENVNQIIQSRMEKSIRKMEADYANLKKKGIYFVTKGEAAYPKRLLTLCDSPQALYVKGSLPDEAEKTIAIVGARNCSMEGREWATYFAKKLADAGVSVISGLAKGIDVAAHRGALCGMAKTYAVMGCSIDICYPQENIETYMQIQRKGGIISEYNCNTKGHPGMFPMRNRLISALSDGIFVIEARKKSGSLITADIGLEQGKEIFALPGRWTDELSAGCNNLIKEGAIPVTEPADILDFYQIESGKVKQDMKKNNKLLATREKMVYDGVGLSPKHITEIIEETKLELQEVMEIIINLELKNYIKEVERNYYVACDE